MKCHTGRISKMGLICLCDDGHPMPHVAYGAHQEGDYGHVFWREDDKEMANPGAYDNKKLRSSEAPDGVYQSCEGLDYRMIKVEGKLYWIQHESYPFMQPVTDTYLFFEYYRVEDAEQQAPKGGANYAEYVVNMSNHPANYAEDAVNSIKDDNVRELAFGQVLAQRKKEA